MNLNNNHSSASEPTYKNVAQGSFNETQIENGFMVLTYKNESSEAQQIAKEINRDFIQFHFCLKGSSRFNFNNGRYTIDIPEENSLLLYNPQRELPIHLEINPKSWLITILVSIKRFHGLFSQEADYITFLTDDNKDKKYYKDGKITPSMAIVLNQIINYNLNQSIKNLYLKAKAYELLSLYFNKNQRETYAKWLRSFYTHRPLSGIHQQFPLYCHRVTLLTERGVGQNHKSRSCYRLR